MFTNDKDGEDSESNLPTITETIEKLTADISPEDLADLFTCLTTAFRISEYEWAAKFLASFCFGVKRNIHKKYQERECQLITVRAMAIADHVHKYVFRTRDDNEYNEAFDGVKVKQ
jgi:carbamoylphosphate synthase small subunit